MHGLPLYEIEISQSQEVRCVETHAIEFGTQRIPVMVKLEIRNIEQFPNGSASTAFGTRDILGRSTWY